MISVNDEPDEDAEPHPLYDVSAHIDALYSVPAYRDPEFENIESWREIGERLRLLGERHLLDAIDAAQDFLQQKLDARLRERERRRAARQRKKAAAAAVAAAAAATADTADTAATAAATDTAAAAAAAAPIDTAAATDADAADTGAATDAATATATATAATPPEGTTATAAPSQAKDERSKRASRRAPREPAGRLKDEPCPLAQPA